MLSWFTLAQLAFALFVVGVVAERVRALCFRDATSDEGLRWLVRSLEQGDRERPRAWARERPRAHVARVIACAIENHAGTNDQREGQQAQTNEFAPVDHGLSNMISESKSQYALKGEQDLRELLADLREEATARLRLLRVSATLASTTGLLGGILRLARGPLEVLGLSALRAGEAERIMVAEAITTMAIGVALSAFCFQALALLRPAARQLISQAQRAARAVSLREEAWMCG